MIAWNFELHKFPQCRRAIFFHFKECLCSGSNVGLAAKHTCFLTLGADNNTQRPCCRKLTGDCRYRSFSSINSHTFIIFVLEDKIQHPGEFLFRFSLGGLVKFSRSIEGKDFPNFEMLDARIASALNKIIQNTRFKKMVSRLLSGYWSS